MFKFFKKTHPMSSLYEHYTNEEKMVILSILFLAGICDNDEIYNDILSSKYEKNNLEVTLKTVA